MSTNVTDSDSRRLRERFERLARVGEPLPDRKRREHAICRSRMTPNDVTIGVCSG
jgi:hypothetical protein